MRPSAGSGKIPLYLPLIFSVPSLILIALALITALPAMRAAGGASAQGTVVALEAGPPGAGGLRPVVRFSAGGAEQTIYGSYSATPEYAVGDTVAVSYDPADPAGATLGGFGDLWLLPIILGTLGIAMAVASIALSIAGIRQRRKAAPPPPRP
jgi:hypothetical protein